MKSGTFFTKRRNRAIRRKISYVFLVDNCLVYVIIGLSNKTNEIGDITMGTIVRLTKSGKPVWASNGVKREQIREAIKSEGYSTQLSLDELMKGKLYIARSANTVYKRIENVFRSQSQLNNFLKEWNRWDHLHDSIEVVNRDYFELAAVRNLLGSDVTINL